MIVLMNDLEEWAIRDIVRRLKKSGITRNGRAPMGTVLADFYDEAELIAKTGEVSERDAGVGGRTVRQIGKYLAFIAKEAYASVGKTVAYDSVRVLLKASRDRMLDDVLNLTGTLGFAVQKNGKTVFQNIGQFYLDTLNRAQMQVMAGVATTTKRNQASGESHGKQRPTHRGIRKRSQHADRRSGAPCGYDGRQPNHGSND